MAKVVVLDRAIAGWTGVVWLVKIGSQHYVVSRADTIDHGDETMVFKCDEKADKVDWSDVLVGHGVSHEAMVRRMEEEL